MNVAVLTASRKHSIGVNLGGEFDDVLKVNFGPVGEVSIAYVDAREGIELRWRPRLNSTSSLLKG